MEKMDFTYLYSDEEKERFAWCRQMADKLGHTIRMESEIGKGTKVWIGFDLDYADMRD